MSKISVPWAEMEVPGEGIFHWPATKAACKQVGELNDLRHYPVEGRKTLEAIAKFIDEDVYRNGRLLPVEEKRDHVWEKYNVRSLVFLSSGDGDDEIAGYFLTVGQHHIWFKELVVSETDELVLASSQGIAKSSDAAQPSTPKRDLPKGKGKGKEKESDSPPRVSPGGSPPVSPDKGVPLPVAGSVFAGASAPPLSPEPRRRAGISRAAFDRAFQVGSSSAAARKELRMPFQRHPYAYRSVLGAPTGPTAPPPSKMHESGGGASTSYTTIPAAAVATTPVRVPKPTEGSSSLSTSPSSVGSSGSSDGEIPGLRMSDTSDDDPPAPSPTQERRHKGEDSDSSASNASLSGSSGDEAAPRPELEKADERRSGACSSAQAAFKPEKSTPIGELPVGFEFDEETYSKGKDYIFRVTVIKNDNGKLTVELAIPYEGKTRRFSMTGRGRSGGTYYNFIGAMCYRARKCIKKLREANGAFLTGLEVK